MSLLGLGSAMANSKQPAAYFPACDPPSPPDNTSLCSTRPEQALFCVKCSAAWQIGARSAWFHDRFTDKRLVWGNAEETGQPQTGCFSQPHNKTRMYCLLLLWISFFHSQWTLGFIHTNTFKVDLPHKDHITQKEWDYWKSFRPCYRSLVLDQPGQLPRFLCKVQHFRASSISRR